MPAHIENQAAVTLVTTTETLIAIITPADLNLPTIPTGQPVGPSPMEFVVDVNVLPGTGATSIQFRLRQAVAGGALTGTVVGVVHQDDVTPAIPVETGAMFFEDLVGFAGGYFLTAQQVGATTNGTVNLVSGDVNVQ